MESTTLWHFVEPVSKDGESIPPEEKEKPTDRHVSFDSTKAADLAYFRSRSLSNSKSSKDMKKMPFNTGSLPADANQEVTQVLTRI